MLGKFCVDRNIHVDDETWNTPELLDELCDYVEKQYQVEIVEDPDGNLGIEVDNEAAGTYEYERGVEESLTKRKRSTATSSEEATARFAEKLAKMQVKSWHQPQHEGTTRRKAAAAAADPRAQRNDIVLRHLSVHAANESVDDQPTTLVMDDGEDEQSEPQARVQLCGKKSGAASNTSTRSTPRKERPGEDAEPPTSLTWLPQGSQASLRGAPAAKRGRGRGGRHLRGEGDDDGDEGDGGDGGSSRGDGPHQPAKRSRTDPGSIIATAQEKLDAAKAAFDWIPHWECRNKRKDFDAKIAALRVMGRRCGVILRNKAATQVSENCFLFADEADERQAFYENVRERFDGLVSMGVTMSLFSLLMNAPLSLLLQIVSLSCERLIDGISGTPDRGQVVLAVMNMNPTQPVRTGGAEEERIAFKLGNVRDIHSPAHQEDAEAIQKSLVANLAEKIFRCNEQSIIMQCLRALDSEMGEVRIKGLDVTNDKLKLTEAGWFPQTQADLFAMRVLGRVIAAQHTQRLRSPTSSKTPSPPGPAGSETPIPVHQMMLGPEVRQMCHDLVSNIAKVSPRIKVHFKTINGAHVQHIRKAWLVLESIARDRSAEVEACDAGRLDKVALLLAALKKAIELAERFVPTDAAPEVPWEEVHGAVVDVVAAKDELHLERLGSVWSATTGPATATLAAELGGALMTALCIVLRNASCTDAVKILLNDKAPVVQSVAKDTEAELDDYDAADELVQWLEQAMALLSHFKPDDQQLQEVLNRLRLFREFTALVKDSNCEASRKASSAAVVVMRSWSELWEKHLAITTAAQEQAQQVKTGVAPDSARDLALLSGTFEQHTQVREAISRWAVRTIQGFIKDQDTETSAMAFNTAVLNMQDILPREMKEMADASNSFMKLREYCDTLGHGKAVPLGDMAKSLHGVHHYKGLLFEADTVKPSYERVSRGVGEEFRQALAENRAKVDQAIEDIKAFAAPYEGLPAAVEQWNFEGYTFMNEVQPEERQQLAARVRTAVQQMPGWLNKVEEVAPYISIISTDDAQRWVTSIITAIEFHRGRINLAALRYATVTIVSELLKGTTQKDMKELQRLLKEQLGVTPELLQPALTARMLRLEGAAGASAEKAASTGPSAGAAASTSTGAASSSDSTAAGGKKLKKLNSKKFATA